MEKNKPPLSDGNTCAAETKRKKNLQFNCTLIKQSTLYHLKLLNETIFFFFFSTSNFSDSRQFKLKVHFSPAFTIVTVILCG